MMDDMVPLVLSALTEVSLDSGPKQNVLGAFGRVHHGASPIDVGMKSQAVAR